MKQTELIELLKKHCVCFGTCNEFWRCFGNIIPGVRLCVNVVKTFNRVAIVVYITHCQFSNNP